MKKNLNGKDDQTEKENSLSQFIQKTTCAHTHSGLPPSKKSQFFFHIINNIDHDLLFSLLQYKRRPDFITIKPFYKMFNIARNELDL